MIAALLRDKSLKPKEKTELLCNWLLEGKLAREALRDREEKDSIRKIYAAALRKV